MLNVGKIEEGFVLDHIKAGKSLSIYEHLQLDKLDCTVAIIKNARSGKMGKKDILKVECDIDMLDLDVLAFIDHNITVNVIKNGEIVEKKVLVLPKQIKNVIKCRNPRCITSIEQGLPHVFVLSDEKKRSTAANTAKKYSEAKTYTTNALSAAAGGAYTILIPHHPLFSFHYLPASAYTLFLTLPELAVIAENQLIHMKIPFNAIEMEILNPVKRSVPSPIG